MTLGSLYVEFFGILSIIFYCTKCEKRSLRSVGFSTNGAFKQYLIGLGVGLLMFSSVMLIGYIFGVFVPLGIDIDINILHVALFFGGFIFQGMFEEVVCRGYIMISSSRKNPIIYGVIFNSLFFALLHAANPGISILAIVNLTLFGIFASVYMLRTDNIWGVGAIHTIWNFAQGNIFGLSVSGMDTMPTIFIFRSTGNTLLNGGDFGPEGGLIVTVVLSIAIAAVLIFTPNKTIENTNNADGGTENNVAESDE
jgi:membrane protease YdiL (CAAX protease family)